MSPFRLYSQKVWIEKMTGIARFSNQITERQKIFAENYVINGLNAVRAAKCAGYKGCEKTAHLLLQRKNIQRYIDQLLHKIRAEGATFEWKVSKLIQAVDTSINDTEVKSTGIAAIAELNKMQGHYSADKVVTAHINIDSDIERGKALVNRLLEENKSEY